MSGKSFESAANHSHLSTSKSALILCYSPVGRDARVTKQVVWLEEAGYRVDILSRGPEHPTATGQAYRIGYPALWLRLAAYVLLPLRARFRWLIEKNLPTAELRNKKYDLVLVNDHQLLPWIVKAAPALTDGPVVLDLHEVYAGTDTSLFYRLLIAPFDRWLLTHLSSGVFTKRLTVAEGIADLYRDKYGVPRPTVIRNVAPYVELEPSPVDPNRIVLVHHGYAALERGIDLLLDAVLALEPRFVLRLMVLGDEAMLAQIRQHPAVVGGRAELTPPVPVTEVARALNDCDLEVIFFPPVSPNKIYALPNKFFEAIQARLGVVVGQSQEIVPFVRQHGFGVVVDGWETADLVAAINELSADDITSMKRAASDAAMSLSTRVEGPRFLSEIGA